MQQLRWGICGSGNICQDFVNAVKLLPEDEHKITAVGASNLERAKTFAQKNSVNSFFGSYDDLMQFEEIDIVYVGVVNSFHKPAVLSALSHGKHVLCEKPMGVNAKETKEMVSLARQKKLLLIEAFWSRFFPVYKFLKAELDSGSIGAPKLVTANFGHVLHSDVLLNSLGSGTLLGVGCYCTMLSMFIFKEKPKTIHALGFKNKHDTDDTSSITFTYDNDRMFHFIQSASLPLENRAVVYGTEGRITLPSYFWCPDEIIPKNGDLKTFPLPTFTSDVKFIYPHSEGLSYEAQIIRDCWISGKLECDLMPLDESIAIAEINDEIRRQLGVQYAQDT